MESRQRDTPAVPPSLARSMCLAAGVPLLESGTNGYQGQALVHVKGETECFECAPHAAPKTFPICTIRNTPDRPIHCVVWAKELLFSRLFGPQDQARRAQRLHGLCCRA